MYAQSAIADEIHRLEQLDADDTDDAIDRLEVAFSEVHRVRKPYVESEQRWAAAVERQAEGTATAT